jgi:hypothetical protein
MMPGTKRAAALELDRLIERYGARLALECCADYCRKHLGLDPWAARYDAAADELRRSERVLRRRKVVK